MTVRRIAAASVLITALEASASVHAQQAPAQAPAPVPAQTTAAVPPGGNGPWQVDIAPFFWMPSLGGHVTVRGIETQASATFTQILNHVHGIPIAFMGNMTIHNDDFGFFIQPIYLQLSFTPSTRRFSADITTTNFYMDWGGYYKLIGGSYADGPNRDWEIDAIGGLRYTLLNVDATLNSNDPRFSNLYYGGVSASRTVQWVDPFIGFKGRIGLGKDFQISWRGDVGGFNAGSTFTWNAEATLGYNFTMLGNPTTAFVGYKAFEQNYKSGSGPNEFRWCETLYGPAIGLTAHF